MGRDISIHELVADMIASSDLDKHTALPAKVKSYSKAKHTVEAHIQVLRATPRADGSSALEEVPPIQNVPVAWPGGSGFYLAIPLTEGDEGLLLFSEAAMGVFRETGQLSEPGDLRRHSLSYACFLPFKITNHENGDTGPNSEAVFIVPGGKVLRVSTAGGTADFVALAAKVQTELNILKSAISGAAVVAGDGGASFKSAIIAALATWPGDVASTTLKAEE